MAIDRKPNLAEVRHRINKFIVAESIKVVGSDGEFLGIMTVEEGIKLANEADLDLVEIVQNKEESVCKIMDYNKFKYQDQKKRCEAKKNQKVIEIKKLKLTPTIGQHDYQVKINSIKKFIADGDKVKIIVKLRGREISHSGIGFSIITRITNDLHEICVIDGDIQHEAKNITAVFCPLSQKK